MIRVLRRAVLLLPLPMLVVATGFVFMHARGPYWLGTNFDPAYPYLFNALLLARLEPPILTQHPGTPVQAIGALVIRASHLAAGAPAPLEAHVLRNAESHIHSVVLVGLFLYAGALTMAGGAVLRATRRPELAWLVQATPLFSYCLFFELVDFKPEPILFTLSALFVACLATTLGDTPPSTRWLAVALGVLAGASTATKYTAVALWAGPLVLVPGLRGKLLSAGAAVSSFLLLTIPALPESRRSLNFVWKLASTGGLYGSGTYSELYWPHLATVARSEMAFLLIVLISVVTALLSALGSRRAVLDPSRRAALRLLLAVLAVDAVQIGLFLKQPYQSRYLIPALALQGLNLALVARLACWDGAGRLRRTMAVLMLVGLGAAGLIQAWRLNGHLALLRRAATCQKQARRAAQIQGCANVYYYRSSSPAMALRAGDHHVKDAFRETVRKIDPRALFLYEYSRDGRPRRSGRGALSSEAACFAFQGSPGGPSHPFSDLSAFDRRDFPVEGRVQLVFSCGWEAVYRVDAPNRPEG